MGKEAVFICISRGAKLVSIEKGRRKRDYSSACKGPLSKHAFVL